MSNENKQPANPLFSSSNLNFAPNALFMPVQEQNSAILSAETDPAEEASFIGQTPNFSQQQQPQNVATFTMFSQKSEGYQDPFSSLSGPSISTSAMMQPATISSDQQEPQLVVPPKSPVSLSESPSDSYTSTPSYGAVPQTTPMQPPVFDSSAPPSNPYARSATSGHKPRPMFPSNSQFYQSPPMQPSTYNAPPPVQSQSMPPIASSSSGNYQPTTSPVTPPSFENLASSPVAPPPPSATALYQNVSTHWFFCKKLSDNNLVWCPFSYLDSNMLETAHNSGNLSLEQTVSTDGGRFDVSVNNRERNSVYWDEEPSTVRRATWFCKSDTENRYSPYEENVAERLEVEYRNVVTKGLWHKRIELDNGEVVVVHSPQLIVHFQPVASKDEFGSVFETQMHSKVVKRGISGTEFEKEIPESESGTPDHVVFLCHGIGPVCDLRSRSVVECVDDFRTIHLNLLQSHFKRGLESKKAHRIEFLPIHWHRALHGDATGVDRNVRNLTLPSISRLRHFTNETLLDILFYSSPVYCQTIADTIGNEINSLYRLFLSRNPSFEGDVSLAGHSLGSLILFDLLCHQSTNSEQTPAEAEKQDSSANGLHVDAASVDLSVSSDQTGNGLKTSSSSHSLSDAPEETLEELLNRLNLGNFLGNFEAEQIDMDALLMCTDADLKDIGLPMGPRKKMQGYLRDQREKEARKREMEEQKQKEAELKQQQEAAAALALAETKISAPEMEHVDSIGSFFSGATNVHVDFQQFDVGTGQPVVRYPQLDFHPKNLFALGSPIGVFLSVRGVSELGEEFSLPTCPGFLNIFHPFDPVAYRVEPLVNPEIQLKPVLVPHYKGRKRMHLELKESLSRMGQELKQSIMRSVKLAVGGMQRFAQSHWTQTQKNTEAEVEEEVKNMTEQILQDEQDKAVDTEDASSITSEVRHADLGRLNGGKRIDYVLQERPLESFNDYLFAFQSHLCYWNNEDTVLLVMKELYGMMGVLSDSQLEKQKAASSPALAPPPPAQYTNQGPPMTNISLN
uniref:Phospholipase DDHD2 n=1 Tax=Phallusia mammillata TaxID=59560 RepID=A0A6F9DBH0_9ASCI|nr:phospholipase DDHD2 [Phallusia mammillata]